MCSITHRASFRLSDWLMVVVNEANSHAQISKLSEVQKRGEMGCGGREKGRGDEESGRGGGGREREGEGKGGKGERGGGGKRKKNKFFKFFPYYFRTHYLSIDLQT